MLDLYKGQVTPVCDVILIYYYPINGYRHTILKSGNSLPI